VLNGEFFVGSYSYLSTEGYSDEKLTGRIIYGNDGSKIGVLYFDPESNTLCYVDIRNARDAILSNFNQ